MVESLVVVTVYLLAQISFHGVQPNKTMVRSSTELEYQAIALALTELMWLQSLL